MKKIAIIVLNYNGRENTLDCLSSLQKLKKPNRVKVKIVLVDNNSSDNSVAVIKKKYSSVEVIENSKNLGFAEGNNIGLRWAYQKGYTYFLLLNNDTFVKDDLLSLLVAFAEKRENCLVSPKIYFASGYEFYKDRYSKGEQGKVIWYAGGKIDWQNVYSAHKGVDEVDKGQFNKIKETEFATGCCVFLGRKILEQVGFFDSRYFLYWEDVDLSLRARKKGFKVFYYPKGVVWHKNAGSSASGSKLHDYYLTRNRLLFGMKYACFKTKLALLKEALRFLFKGRQGQKLGSRDFFLFKFGKRAYA
jgi:GT2 family glycosyltransferase